MNMFQGKRILVTGACGTVGRELVKQLLSDRYGAPSEVIGLDNQETPLFFIDQEYISDPRANFFVLDIKDFLPLRKKMEGVDVVFHTAAMKHVVLCERSPEQAMQTNITGLQNAIEAATDCNVEKFIFTSSDKAVNPTNVMGTSKLLGERIVTAANSSKRAKGPIFASTRFGNVLGSSGSVVPIFYNQVMQGGPVTLTHSDMTRFVMSIEQAVRLVIETSSIAKGGEVFITKMPVVKIENLARAIVQTLAEPPYNQKKDIEIKTIGIKPGEKLYEELMSEEETRRAIELENYYVILPAFKGLYEAIDYSYDDLVSEVVATPYTSAIQKDLSVDDITKFLHEASLVQLEPNQKFASRYWPGDKKTT